MLSLRSSLHAWETARPTHAQSIREKSFATPWLPWFRADGSSGLDVYELHQSVWDLVIKHTDACRPVFQFRVDDMTGLTTIRSRFLRPGSFVRNASIPQSDQVDVRISLKAVRQHSGTEHNLDVGQSQDLAQRLLEQSGLVPLSMDLQMSRAQGLKHDKSEKEGGVKTHGGSHHIDFAVAHVTASCTIVDREKLAHAWMHGLGRGKRFGLGMITFR